MSLQSIKQALKSKTIRFNAIMIPIVTYILTVPELWTEYAGPAANLLILVGNIYLRTITTQPLSDK